MWIPTHAKEAAGLAEFAFEMGVLKRVRRTGRWHAGIRDPESVPGGASIHQGTAVGSVRSHGNA